MKSRNIVIFLVAVSTILTLVNAYSRTYRRNAKRTRRLRKYRYGQQRFGRSIQDHTDYGEMIPALAKKVEDFNAAEKSKDVSMAKSRVKRGTFAWPEGTIFTGEFIMEMPFRAPDGIGLPFIIDVPFEFAMPNVTANIFPKKRSIKDRMTIFAVFEGIANRMGINGRECLFRAICERAESDPYEHAGIMNEVMDHIFTVSRLEGIEDDAVMLEYYEAERHGRELKDCAKKYSECPFTVFSTDS